MEMVSDLVSTLLTEKQIFVLPPLYTRDEIGCGTDIIKGFSSSKAPSRLSLLHSQLCCSRTFHEPQAGSMRTKKLWPCIDSKKILAKTTGLAAPNKLYGTDSRLQFKILKCGSW